MGAVGDTLRRARERRGVTLRDAEKETKIRLTYLQAMEEDEFDKLPGRVYALGFLRSYCRFLEIDATPLVSELKTILPQPEEPPLGTTSSFVPGKSTKSWILAVLLILVLALATYFVYHAVNAAKVSVPNTQDTQTSPDEQSNDSGEAASGSTDGPGEEPVDLDNAPEITDKLELTIKIDDEPGARSWMLIRQDDQTAFSGELTSGEQMTFQAEREIFIRIGNAGTVQLSLNGKQLEKLGGPGQVKEKTFSLEQ